MMLALALLFVVPADAGAQTGCIQVTHDGTNRASARMDVHTFTFRNTCLDMQHISWTDNSNYRRQDERARGIPGSYRYHSHFILFDDEEHTTELYYFSEYQDKGRIAEIYWCASPLPVGCPVNHGF